MAFNARAKPHKTGGSTPKIRDPKPEVEHEMPAQEHPVSVQPVEPEDPRKTGSSKPEQRERLEQNVKGEAPAARPHPATAPGQHATGSFTDKKRRAG